MTPANSSEAGVINISTNHKTVTKLVTKKQTKNLSDFLDDIGFRESSDNYDTVNSLGYLGRYQFGGNLLKRLGFKVSKREFLSNPTLQDKAMVTLLIHNKKHLQTYIDRWDGEVVNGIHITESGILAAAHLAGQGNVRKFFKSGTDPSDAYGTSLTEYLDEFSGYELQLN